jgi:lysylphosphatidylglycerol synthetase-like protein (DUF2156 family)
MTKKKTVLSKYRFQALVLFQTTLLILPAIAFGGSRPSNFTQLAANIMQILDPLMVLAVVLAVMFFLYGVVKYLAQYGNEKARGESVQTITYGVIGLFVMVAMWGLVKLLQETLLGGGGAGIPQFQ